jgi:hypothetical protein
MEVKMELRGKRSRQQLERETDETIQQIVAKAKVVPIVQKKSVQVILILHSLSCVLSESTTVQYS